MTTSHTQRAASYSRYSSDNQRDTSIDDQERLQDQRAAALGIEIGLRFSDREISASVPTIQRPGGRAMLEAAHRGEFDVLIIECLDRCWRDIIDQEQVIRGLEFAGIRIIGISDGYDTLHEGRELPRVVYGAVNQEYLRALAKKTHRGLTGQVCRGGHAGGMSYGYRSIEACQVRKLEVVEDQAGWVRWIFERYADGWSCQRIAAELNRLGVQTGRGGTWAVSALYGSPLKGSGVLNNELYVGRYIWNRSKWVIHPETKKRTRLDRPRHEWMVEERPELRILPDDLWAAARARMDGGRMGNGGKGSGPRPRTLLGGLMKCGICGGAVIAINSHKYGCGIHKDRGASVCTGVSVGRTATERRLMAVVRAELLAPAAVVKLRKEVGVVLARRQRTAAEASCAAKAALAGLDKEIARLVDAIAAMGHSEALTARLKAAEANRMELASRLAPRKPGAELKIDDLMARYRRQLLAIETALNGDIEQARPALRAFFGEISISQNDEGAWATFSVDPGRLLLKAIGVSEIGCGDSISIPEHHRIRLR
jgi:DNA invertase Pin-like site-specific DNA recombinase